jgi:uncharacterized protein YuzB (UPF0349 family)
MNTNLDLVGYCGLYCGACSFKLAYDEKDRVHLRGMPAKYAVPEETPLQFCPGCRKDSASGGCTIRSCAEGRGLSHCGVCAEFPCAKVTEFDQDGTPHHGESIANLRRLREVGEALWLEEERRHWTCPCGAKRSWYLQECPECGRAHAQSKLARGAPRTGRPVRPGPPP